MKKMTIYFQLFNKALENKWVSFFVAIAYRLVIFIAIVKILEPHYSFFVPDVEQYIQENKQLIDLVLVYGFLIGGIFFSLFEVIRRFLIDNFSPRHNRQKLVK